MNKATLHQAAKVLRELAICVGARSQGRHDAKIEEAGKLADELEAVIPVAVSREPSFDEIKSAIDAAPITYVPALLIAVVKRAVRDRVFVGGGLMRTVTKAIEDAK